MKKSIIVLVGVVCLTAGQLASAQSSIDIRKQGEGDDTRQLPAGDVPFDIVVSNDGDSTLTGVVVTDTLTPDCDQVIGELPVGQGFAYTCVAPDVTAGFVNEACVVGTGSDDCWCPRTPGYWKNHTEAWPVDELEIGGVTYGADALLAFLRLKERAEDASLKLARHLTAVLLNLEMGSHPSIQPVVDEANAFLALHPPGSDPQGADRTLAIAIKDLLDAYNNEVDCESDTVSCEVTVTDCDNSEVEIVSAGNPAIDIRKQDEGPDGRALEAGTTIEWLIVVKNIGDVELTNVTVDDALVPGCANTLGTMAIGVEVSYTCSSIATVNFDNLACASGDDAGRTVEDCDTSSISIIER